jgi:hypothetical protein
MARIAAPPIPRSSRVNSPSVTATSESTPNALGPSPVTMIGVTISHTTIGQANSTRA